MCISLLHLLQHKLLEHDQPQAGAHGQWPCLTGHPQRQAVTMGVSRTQRRAVSSDFRTQQTHVLHPSSERLLFCPLVKSWVLDKGPGQVAGAPALLYLKSPGVALTPLLHADCGPGRVCAAWLSVSKKRSSSLDAWAAEDPFPTPWRTPGYGQGRHPSRPWRHQAFPISVAWGGAEFTGEYSFPLSSEPPPTWRCTGFSFVPHDPGQEGPLQHTAARVNTAAELMQRHLPDDAGEAAAGLRKTGTHSREPRSLHPRTRAGNRAPGLVPPSE